MSFWKGAKALVTGGNGFIGSHLVEHLVDRGANVTVFDIISPDRSRNLERVAEKITIYNRLVDSESIISILDENHFDFIFHLGSNASVPYSVEEPFIDFCSNLFNTEIFLEHLRTINFLGVFLFPSSAAVYGNPTKLPISEDDPTVPISPYGVAKLSSERYLNVYSQLYGLRGASLRFFSVFGPRQRKLVIYDIFSKLRSNPNSLRLYGNGDEARDFIYVDDVAASFLKVAENGRLIGETYNAASGCATTIRELSVLITRCMKLNPVITFDEDIPASMKGNPRFWQADTTRISNIGFKPEVALEAGIMKTLAWFEEDSQRISEGSLALKNRNLVSLKGD